MRARQPRQQSVRRSAHGQRSRRACRAAVAVARLAQDAGSGYIGLHADQTHAFHGAMDEVAVWRGALGAQHIASLVAGCTLPGVASATPGATLLIREQFDSAQRKVPST